MIPILELHGTWQEIAASQLETGQQRLRVLVLPEAADASRDVRHHLAVIDEIGERGRQMKPRPDRSDYLAEARSAAMFVRAPESSRGSAAHV